MKDKIEKTILTYLVRLDERLDRIEEHVRDLRTRQTLSEESLGQISRAYAGIQTRLDKLDDRLERIESRVERLAGRE